MKKLKIAQLTPYYLPSIGGVQGVVKYISEELVKRYHSVDVITANRDFNNPLPLSIPKFEVFNGVNIFRYKSILNIGHDSIMPGLVKHLIKYKYDVLHYHVHRHHHSSLASFIGKLKYSANILHGHGPFFKVAKSQNSNIGSMIPMIKSLAKRRLLGQICYWHRMSMK